MNINNNQLSFLSNDNGTVTLFAVPVQLIQQASPEQSLVVEEHVLFKTLPDGSFVINANHPSNSNSNSALTTSDENFNPRSIDDSELVLTLQQNDANILDNQTIEIINSNESKIKPDKKNSPKIRYLNKKTIEVRKVGRPRKDAIKLNSNETKQKDPFICKYCDKKFDKWLFLKRHEKSHSNEKKYKCVFCSASFNILSNHVLHLASHNTDNPSCPECGKKFQRIASLKAHLLYHEKEETFYCEECDILFDNDIQMNEHLEEQHGLGKKEENDLSCRYCQLPFTDQLEFKQHMREHREMRSILHINRKKSRRAALERNHECNICNKTFQKQSQIERHMRVHSGEKPFICKVCGRGFSQKGSLQIHMSRHTGIKPHKCTLCLAKFSQKGNLRAHILKTHSISTVDENVFCCSECSCVFKRLGSLNGHMTRNHPKRKNITDINFVLSQLSAMENNLNVDNNILQESMNNPNTSTAQNIEVPTVTYVTLATLGLDGSVRTYLVKQRKAGDIRWHICSFCPKEFKKPSDLIRHLRVHTREKPFVCKYCGRAFAIKSTLTSHIKTHTKCTDLQCKYCHMSFSSWTSLNAHSLKHAGTKHKCHICSKGFRSKTQLTQHLKTHLGHDLSYFKDPNSDHLMLAPIQITSRGLEPISSLRKRPLLEAGCKTRPYSCKICGGGFKKLSHLKQHHILKHTCERPYSCSHCFRNFGSTSILKAHLSTHTGTRPYECPVCLKNFTTKGSLNRHMVAHSISKPYICPYCFLDFKSLIQCKKHISIHYTNEVDLQMIDVNCDIVENELIDPETTELTNNLDNTLPNQFTIVPLSSLENTSLRESTKIINEVENSISLLQNNSKNQNTGNLTQEIDENLNNQMLNIIGSENFIDTSSYVNKINVSRPIATTDELVSTLTGSEPQKQIEDNPFLYQQVIVNLNPELPMFDNNGLENIVSTLKIENDSLFLTDLNSLNLNESNNVLLPFQITPQSEIQQNQLIMLPSELDQDIQTESINAAVTLESIDPNLQLKITNMNRYLNSTQSLVDTNDLTITPIIQAPEYLNVDENMIAVEIPSLSIKSEQTNILTNVLTAEKSTICNNVNNKVDICNMCKISFECKDDLNAHQCINLIQFAIDGSNIIQCDNIEENSNNSESTGNDIDPLELTLADRNITQKEFLDLVAKRVVQSNKNETSITVKHRNQCSYCPKSFRKPSDLLRHLRTHTGERPFKCAVCEKSFSLKSTMESHSKIHQVKKGFTCLVCNCLLSTKGSLNLHMRLHTGVKPYKCPLCPLRFRTSGHLKAHLTVHYKAVLKTGKISTDGIARKSKMAEFVKKVENIMNSNVNDEQANAAESICEINFESILLDDSNKLNPCINSVEDLQKEDKPLNMHFEIETNTEGQIVNIKPTSSNILFIDETSKKEVASTQVEFDEKTKLQIENFLRDKKEKQIENKNRLKKVCNVCQKEFSTKYLLDRHSKIHTGERLFSCNYCAKSFNQKNALQIHLRTHSGNRPYSCPHCSNNFSQIGNLKTHIKRIHGTLNTEQILENTEMGSSEYNVISIDNVDVVFK